MGIGTVLPRDFLELRPQEENAEVNAALWDPRWLSRLLCAPLQPFCAARPAKDRHQALEAAHTWTPLDKNQINAY